jgi:hypothetical protein
MSLPMSLQFAVLSALLCAVLPDVVPGQSPPVIQTETRLVSVDVIVTGKKDQPVRDLSAKDFRIWEGQQGTDHPKRLLERQPAQPHDPIL